MLHRTEGIVIRSMDYGEGHKIVSLYTQTSGKMSLMVRGAKKLKSRHSAIVQLFTHGDFVVYKGSGMGNLNHGEIIHSYMGIREDLHKAAYASYMVELVDRVCSDGEPNGTLYDQILAGLTAIEQGKDPAVVLHIMELKMLALSGYYPQLEECVLCGKDSPAFSLSAGQGGLLCSSCKAADPSALLLSPTVLRLLRLFQRVDLRRLGTADIKPETRNQLRSVLRTFMDTHMDVRWKSRNFLDQMEKYNL